MTPRAFALAAVLAGATAPLSAAAEEPVEGLAWKWNDKSIRYQINGSIFVPDWVWMRALNNLEIRVNELYIETVLTCAPREPAKKRWEIRCNIDGVGIQAAALPNDARREKEGEEAALTKILQEWSERLKDTGLVMLWSDTGRIRSVTLPELSRLNRRDGENIEIIRQVFVRVLSPLEIVLPKKGTDKGLRSWTEKEPLIAGFLSDFGTVGSVPTEHVIDAQRGNQVRIRTQGAGTVSNASKTQAVAGSEQLADFYEVEFTTESFFDTAAGHLVRREAIFGGTPTASSAIADGTAGLPYLQTYRVQLIPADAPPPLVMPSREVEPELFKAAEKARKSDTEGAMPAPPTTEAMPAPPTTEAMPAPPTTEAMPAPPAPPPQGG
jgi:hypothetical protein